MKAKIVLPLIFLVVIWIANINDLIRGTWFYPSTIAIIFWNFIGVVALICIITELKKK